MKRENDQDEKAIQALQPLPDDGKSTNDPETPVWTEKGPQMAPDTLEKLKQWEKETEV